MAKDRTASIKAIQASTSIEMDDIGFSHPSFSTMNEFQLEVEEIDSKIVGLEADITEITRIHSKILSDPQVEDSVRKQLEELNSNFKHQIKFIKSKLKQMEHNTQQIATEKELSAEHRIRKTQHHVLHHKFVEVVTRYQHVQEEHREKCKNRIVRQMQITHRETNEDEIEEMIEQNNPAIFTQGIIMDTQQQRQALAEIEARHSDIMKLEKSIKELRDIFVDMATLVENQSEMVDRIEQHVLESKSHVEQAYQTTKEAMIYQSKARVKKFICFGCLILIVVAIVLTSISV